MIVVTGGAGFIGSALIAALNQRGRGDILVVDRLGETEKWKNLPALRFHDYLDKADFIEQLEAGRLNDAIEAIFHLGACSSTTEADAAYLMENNYRYTLRLGKWRERHPGCRFIYASSAATYGDGSAGYTDDESKLRTLRPLNMYGYSKHLFDLAAQRQGWLTGMAGLKYFNVFGPNEYHKGDMRSVVAKAYPVVRDEGRIRLFRSYRSEYGHGEQVRDFIYVKDAVQMTLFFFDHPEVNGIFNVGTGVPRSWNDLAGALFAALEKPTNIEYIPMPATLKNKYQYYTRADTKKLTAAGCPVKCRSLESAVMEYVQTHLNHDRYLSADCFAGP